jgi:hypothetical protein
MVTIHPREDWQLASQPVTGPTYPSTIIEVVYHYPGASAGTSFAYPAARLRAMQSDYLRNRGYSLGYSYAIDPYGEAWEIRGVDIKPAATAGYNHAGCAVQFMVPGQQPASEVQIGAAVELHKWLEKHHGRSLGVTGHKFRGTTSTPCPGVGVTAQLGEIERRVRYVPPPVPPPPAPPTTDEGNNHMWFIARYVDDRFWYFVRGDLKVKTATTKQIADICVWNKSHVRNDLTPEILASIPEV